MVLHSLTHSIKTLELLNKQRQENAFTDFMIYVSGKKFPVHRSLLAAHSPLIKRALEANKHDRNPDINLDGVDCSCFAILLDFLYTSNLNVNAENVEQLLVASKFLEIFSVVELCSQFQQSSVKTSSTDPSQPSTPSAVHSNDNEKSLAGRKRGRKPAKRVPCPICHKEVSESRLKAHFQNHSGENRAVCPQCGKSFANVYNLKVHVRQHTGERPFQCKQCPSSFADPSSLSKHKLWHSGVKRHKCAVCARLFATRANVDEHMRTHTGERPFKCPQCKRDFAFKCDLSRHMKEHNGELLGPCEYCGRTFNHTGNYKAHLRTHQKNLHVKALRHDDVTYDTTSDVFVLPKSNDEHSELCGIAQLVADGREIEVVVDSG